MGFFSALCVAAMLSIPTVATASGATAPSPIADARQLVVVTTADWDSTRGELRRYERDGAAWTEVGVAFPVMIGRSGSAWGLGLHARAAPREGEPRKVEGDGRAPAGVYAIGTAFGYADAVDTRLPYRAMTKDDWCVDVPDSPRYNRIVGEHVEGSTEPMRRDLHADGDRRYALGFVIEHNTDAVPRAGSCIFAHLWKADGETTAGCTAMAEPAMRELLAWLDADAKPRFVLWPRSVHARVAQAWGLPADPIDALMADYAGEGPGATLAIVRDGRVDARAYGYAELDAKVPMRVDHRLRLASITKQLTAAAILELSRANKLSLDDSLRHWLPELPPIAARMTLRHALEHTAGLVDYEDVMPAEPERQLTANDVLALLAPVDRAYFDPGSRWRYSNSGYVLLGLVVERASGMPFGRYLDDALFAPLGMRHTTLGPREPRAFGHSRDGGRWIETDQSSTSATPGDGGAYASVEDLARWIAASDRYGELAIPRVDSDDANVRYGWGLRVTGDTVWHSGETTGFRNVVVRWPKHDAAIVILTNRSDGDPYTLALAIAKTIGLPTEPRAEQAEVGPPSS